MDRRTILAVIALTFVLFFVNNYFGSQHEEELRIWKQQQQSQKTSKAELLQQDILQNTIHADQLALTPIYLDNKAETAVTEAFADDKSLLTLAWTATLPTEIYARLGGTIQSFKLVTENPVEGAPVIYSQVETPDFKAAILPNFGTYTLQLVSLPEKQVTYAQYSDGTIEVPAQELAKILKELDKGNEPAAPHSSIAFYKSNGSYTPVGWYNAKENKLVSLNNLPTLHANIIKKDDTRQPITYNGSKAEAFYVLENQYQQLVFSNYGGALAEINLPFESDTNESSVVQPVEYDRLMVEHHSQNAYFPLHPYTTPDKTFHETGTLGGYYPLIRRDLIQKGAKKSTRVPPQYYALNVVSGSFADVAELVYEVKEFTPNKIVFEATQPHRRITKTFSIESEVDAPYIIKATIEVDGDSRNLWLTSGVPEVEWISGAPAPALKIRETLQGKPSVTELSLPTDTQIVNGRKPDWTSNGNGFFGIIQDGISNSGEGYATEYVSGTTVPSRLSVIEQEYNLYPAEKMPGYATMLPLNKKGGKMEYRIYAGPYTSKVLNKVDAVYSNAETGYNPDYTATETFHGWFAFISEPFARFLFILMNFFHTITGSWGFSIILLTLALRIMLWPLNAWSAKSMLKMKEVTPLAAKLQEKYKGDPKKLQLEMMNLYRDKGVNPISGCFPVLIQIPFLIGMFGLLKSTFELRGAPFIPGWIDNLAAPDVAFSWTYPLPFIGNELHLLPFLVGGMMLLQQHMMSPVPENQAEWTEQQRQQRTMGNIMAIVMVFIFYNMPSGLNIYFAFSTFFGIAQQWWTNRRVQLNQPQVVVETASPRRRK
jgi:YidC/Oxa1 family membrane protein insertase